MYNPNRLYVDMVYREYRIEAGPRRRPTGPTGPRHPRRVDRLFRNAGR